MTTVYRLYAHAHSYIHSIRARCLLSVTAATVAIALALCIVRPLQAADFVAAQPCTEEALRKAVDQLALAGGGSIEMACTADLAVTRPITVTSGISLTISGNALLKSSGDRLFVVEPTAALTLRGLTLTGALRVGNGGAIYSAGRLTLHNMRLLDNQATRGGALYIEQGATLTVTASTFERNKAIVEGGALYLAGSAYLTDTTWSANQAPNAGAIRVLPGAHATVDDCLMREGSGDTAPALHNSGETDLSRCIITNMITTVDHGDYGAVDNDGLLRITNTIFLDNKGVDANSLHNHTVTPVNLSRIELTYVTMLSRAPGGLAEVINNGDLTMRNSVLNFAAGSTCYNGPITEPTPKFVSLGGNVLSDDGCFTATSTDHFGGAPLGVATDPMGRLLVFPTSASPAIDGAVCVKPDDLDMRAVSRPQGKGCDSGAIEVRTAEVFYRMLLPIAARP